MAPPAQRRPVPRNDFPKYFSSLKTNTYIDTGNRPIHGTTHRTIAWNNTGTLVATGATDRVVRIWNPERTAGNPKPQAELKGHTLEVTKVMFNPVKEYELASCSKDGTVRFWDVRDRSKPAVHKLDLSGDLFSMSWSTDGTVMVVGSKSEVLTIISTPEFEPPVILEKHRQKMETNQTTFSMTYPPQDLFVTHGDGSFRVLDYPSYDPIHSFPSHTSSCTAIAFSPLGNYVAVGGADAMIALWDTYDWVCKRTMSNPSSGKVSGLSWSWDGRYITSSCEDIGSGGGEGKSEGFEIYHAETGEIVHTVPTRTNSVPAVAWHPRTYALAYTVVENGKSSLKIIGDPNAS